MSAIQKPETLGEIAVFLGGRLEGPGDLPVEGIQSLSEAGPREISFAVAPRYMDAVRKSRAGSMILPENWPQPPDRPAVLVEDPYLAYARLATAFVSRPFEPAGISAGAVIGDDCCIDDNVSICAGVFIGNRVTVGPGVTLHPGVFLGDDVSIGEGCTLHPNVVVYHDCSLGRRVSVHACTVIGSDGFGYVRSENGYVKIPQTGRVVIEDDVEIGANTAIDRAALGETRIGRGTKIDNLVQVGHNVTIGEHSVLVAQVGVSGSTKLGRHVVLGGQAGVVGHIELGDGAMAGAQTGIAKSVPAGEVVSGTPAMPHKLWLKVGSLQKRLPDIIKEFRELKERVRRLEEQS